MISSNVLIVIPGNSRSWKSPEKAENAWPLFINCTHKHITFMCILITVGN